MKKNSSFNNSGLIVLGNNPDHVVDHPDVYYAGSVPHSLCLEIFSAADWMIHLAWLDWCPNSVVEGLASGLPVLCSHNGGTKELVKNDGVVVRLEKDYKIGEMLDLYAPPNIDINLVVEGVRELVEMPKIPTREDLKIRKAALSYSKLFI